MPKAESNKIQKTMTHEPSIIFTCCLCHVSPTQEKKAHEMKLDWTNDIDGLKFSIFGNRDGGSNW